jgi:hypothetical protein
MAERMDAAGAMTEEQQIPLIAKDSVACTGLGLSTGHPKADGLHRPVWVEMRQAANGPQGTGAVVIDLTDSGRSQDSC